MLNCWKVPRAIEGGRFFNLTIKLTIYLHWARYSQRKLCLSTKRYSISYGGWRELSIVWVHHGDWIWSIIWSSSRLRVWEISSTNLIWLIMKWFTLCQTSTITLWLKCSNLHGSSSKMIWGQLRTWTSWFKYKKSFWTVSWTKHSCPRKIISCTNCCRNCLTVCRTSR